MLFTNRDLQVLNPKLNLWKKNESIYEIPTVSIQLSETVGIDTDNAYGNNVPNVDNCSSNTGNSMKMSWLCMLCKMCDVRVCIGLVVVVAVAFIAIIIAILILMH